MNLVLPILLAAVFVGLFVRRVTVRVWWALGVWILLIALYHYVKS